MSTGSKDVSLRLSKPTPNSIWGTEHDPKFPMLPEDAAAVLVAALAEVETLAVSAMAVVAALTADVTTEDAALLPVPAIAFPWSSIAVTSAKFWETVSLSLSQGHI